MSHLMDGDGRDDRDGAVVPRAWREWGEQLREAEDWMLAEPRSEAARVHHLRLAQGLADHVERALRRFDARRAREGRSDG